MKFARFFVLALAIIAFTTAARTRGPGSVEVTLICDFEKAKEAGKYDWVHPAYGDASDAPSTNCKNGEKVKITFFNVGQEIVTFQDAEDEIRRHSCRPATWPELFAVGAQHPDLQRDYHIVAIGSIWKYTAKNPMLKKQVLILIPSLYWDEEDGKNLGMDTIVFSGEWHFAAVCGGK
ncbi:hypothetical protein KJ657_02050 [Patescibacteria group bacterium]|nr:hypothetical protein [Patescibacteria group bacterium]MBU1015851.1 hypothetical protein [Patescibacteria group bacterium]MBU1685400.1 hypothetical protein [Patescibacteria group bacterium]MBU1938441.1 hypothetical protein [Patescibacteria group bacterium]